MGKPRREPDLATGFPSCAPNTLEDGTWRLAASPLPRGTCTTASVARATAPGHGPSSLPVPPPNR